RHSSALRRASAIAALHAASVFSKVAIGSGSFGVTVGIKAVVAVGEQLRFCCFQFGIGIDYDGAVVVRKTVRVFHISRATRAKADAGRVANEMTALNLGVTCWRAPIANNKTDSASAR